MFRFQFILLLFFFCIKNTAGQDTVNQTDSKNRMQGQWIKYDSAGNKAYEGRFMDGVPVGEFRYFYPDGRLRTITQYSDNGKRANTISYFQNGMKMAAGKYLNEKKDSVWQFFNRADGALLLEENYKNGKRSGVGCTYYPQGGIAGIVHWKDGNKDGVWEEYYSNGSIKMHGTYNMNDKTGPFQGFYESGSLLVMGQYIEGHQDGVWTFFDEDGTVSRKETWDKGNLVIPKK
jgi:antitoxin component YwqK of YwqJK toxin-antitoxin module